MSSSKARSAKYMKAIAAYEQADIAEAVGVLDDAQQRVLATLVKKIHNKLEGMKVEVVKRKERSLKSQQSLKNRNCRLSL
jgi:uncharacterized OB-fold protein